MTAARRQRLQSARAALALALDTPDPAGALARIPGLRITRFGILTRLNIAGLDASSSKGLPAAARNWCTRAETALLMEKNT